MAWAYLGGMYMDIYLRITDAWYIYIDMNKHVSLVSLNILN